MPDRHPTIVRKQDVVAAGFCGPGLKEWCRLNGFTAQDVSNGIPEDRIIAAGCSLGMKCLEKAREREAFEIGILPGPQVGEDVNVVDRSGGNADITRKGAVLALSSPP